MPLQIRRGIFKGLVSWIGGVSIAGLLLNSRAQSARQISGFDHVAVPMRNEQAMVDFYRSLGFVVNEGTRICSVHFGDHKINFHREALWNDKKFTLRAPAAQPPCGDFCFVWSGSADELVALLERARASIIEGPVQRQGGRDGGSARGVSRYIRDPDGNLLEFIIY